MSQAKVSGMSSSTRTAMAVAIVALVLGAASLGYTVYLGVFSVPNQFSTFPSVNQPHTTWNITIDWVSTYNSGQDRFSPQYITIAQGDTVMLTFISNDTDDGHTFTMKLPTSTPGNFQLNNSAIGQVNVLTQPETTFTTSARNCSDQNGSPVTCQTTGGCFASNGSPTTCPGATAMLTAKGSFTVSVPGLYRFRCLYHERFGM